MRKYNDVVNENTEGIYDNTIAVNLIVKDYKFIRENLFKLIKENVFDTIDKNLLSYISDCSEKTTIIKIDNKDSIKYLGIQFSLDNHIIKREELDITDLYTKIRENLKELFKLNNNSLKMYTSNYLYFQIDYHGFLKSDLYKSLTGLKKYNL